MFMWPVQFDSSTERYSINRTQLVLTAILTVLVWVFFIFMAFLKVNGYPNSNVTRAIMVIALLTWILPVQTIQIHFLLYGEVFVSLMNTISLHSMPKDVMLKTQTKILRFTAAAFAYYVPVLTTYNYIFRLKGLFGEVNTNLQYLSPIVYHFISLFLTYHSTLQYAIGLCLREERHATKLRLFGLERRKKNESYIKWLMQHSDDIQEHLVAFTKYFFKTSIAKTCLILLDFITMVFDFIDEVNYGVKWKYIIANYTYYLLADLPIFVMFIYSQTVSSPTVEVSCCLQYKEFFSLVIFFSLGFLHSCSSFFCFI